MLLIKGVGMMTNNEVVRSLLEQALALMGGPTGTVSVIPAGQAARTYGGGAAGGREFELKFGKHKGSTLDELLAQGETRYLRWVADKFGLDDNGFEDPKWAAKNQKMRAHAAQLLNGGTPSMVNVPMTAPVPAPVPSPTILDDEIPF
jgi:hypothetical protein